MLPGVETGGSPSHYLVPGDFFTHLQSFPQLHLPPLSHPHVFSPQALQLMSFLLPVRHRRFCSMQTHGQGAMKLPAGGDRNGPCAGVGIMAQVLRANGQNAQSLPARLAKSLTSVGTLVAQRTIVAMLSSRTITKHSIAAAMLLLAAATGLIVPCLCEPATAASQHTDDHSCCKKEAGIQAADATCCSDPGLPTSSVTWTAADSVILATPGPPAGSWGCRGSKRWPMPARR